MSNDNSCFLAALPTGSLSDSGISAAISNKEIEILHDSSDSFTPVGYDLRVGKKGWIWTEKNLKQVEIEQKGSIELEPGDTALIVTIEEVILGDRISGTIHAKVSLSSLGFSILPTTVDPTWGHINGGFLLIQISNVSQINLRLEYEEPFCTVLFYRNTSKASKINKKPGGFDDICKAIVEFEKERFNRTTEKFRSAIVSWPTLLAISFLLGYALTFASLAVSMVFIPSINLASALAPILGGGAALGGGIFGVLHAVFHKMSGKKQSLNHL
jgi:deoxycytidine triphosphate deaminase